MKKTGLIAVAGIIGVGKTTLTLGLGDILPGRTILEEYDRNPFLAAEFDGRQDAALPSELFFLLSRARQLHQQTLADDQTVICDYIFDKNRIYAGMNLNNDQFNIYRQVEKSIEPHLAAPDWVIYLQDTIENCLERIARRGREYEKIITDNWLSELHAAYQQLFQNWNRCPLLRIDCAQFDIRDRQTVQDIARQWLCAT
jgi:deoxyguanosine kinase